MNQAHCKPPLDDREFDKLLDQSLRFILKSNDENGKSEVGINEIFRSHQKNGDEPNIIKEASEAITKK